MLLMFHQPHSSLQDRHHTRDVTITAFGDALPFITTRPSGPLTTSVRRRCNRKGCVMLERECEFRLRRLGAGI
jgi:hypothetical protein